MSRSNKSPKISQSTNAGGQVVTAGSIEPTSNNTAWLEELLHGIGQLHVAVMGDFFLDSHLVTDPSLAEVSLETGLAAHQVVELEHSPGAAGNVVRNLAALGTGRISAIGFTGEDGTGWELRRGLTELNCDLSHFHAVSECHTPTYLKPRTLGVAGIPGEHERYDTQNRLPTPETVIKKLCNSLDKLAPELDVLIITDQVSVADSGVMCEPLINVVAGLSAKYPQLKIVVDSRYRLTRYRNVIAKTNERELFHNAGLPIPSENDVIPSQDLHRAAERLAERISSPVIATLAARGTFVPGTSSLILPSLQIEGPTDPTGAGDSFVSAFSLALAAGGTLAAAVLLGNLTAATGIQQLGRTGTASPQELRRALQTWNVQNPDFFG